MKKGKLVKNVISPLLLVISALSFSVGTTYSLFSSSSDININISSAKLSIVPSVNVSSSLSASAYTVSNNVLYLNSLSNGDTLSITLSLKNESSISSKYRVLISTTDDSSSFTLKDSNNNTLSLSSSSDYKGSYSNLLSVGTNPSDLTYSLVANSELTNKTLTFKVEVVAGNKDVSEETHKVSIDSNITNGSIVESTKGTSRCLTISPNEGKSLASLSIDGTLLTNEELKECLSIDQETGNYIYDLTSLNKDIEVSATFSDSTTNDLTIYQASLEDSNHIKLTSGGTYYSTICPLKVKATIDNGYSISSWQYKESSDSETYKTITPTSSDNNTYTFTTSNISSIKATTTEANVTVSSSSSSNGEITYTKVSETNTTPYITIKPNDNYSLETLKIGETTLSLDSLKTDTNLVLDQVNGNYKYYLNDLNSDIEVSATYSDTSSKSNDLTIYTLSLTNSSNITLSSKDNYSYFNNSNNKAYISVSGSGELEKFTDNEGKEVSYTKETLEDGNTYCVFEVTSSLSITPVAKSTTSNKDINDALVNNINSALSGVTTTNKTPSEVLDALYSTNNSYNLYKEDLLLDEDGTDVYPIYDYDSNKIFKSNDASYNPSNKSNCYIVAFRKSNYIIEYNEDFSEFDSSYGLILTSSWYTYCTNKQTSGQYSSIICNRNMDLKKATLNKLGRITFSSSCSTSYKVWSSSDLWSAYKSSTQLELLCFDVINESTTEQYFYFNNDSNNYINSVFINGVQSGKGTVYLSGGYINGLFNHGKCKISDVTIKTLTNWNDVLHDADTTFVGTSFVTNCISMVYKDKLISNAYSSYIRFDSSTLRDYFISKYLDKKTEGTDYSKYNATTVKILKAIS